MCDELLDDVDRYPTLAELARRLGLPELPEVGRGIPVGAGVRGDVGDECGCSECLVTP